MPATNRTRSSASSRGGSKGSDSTLMIGLLGLAAAGGAWLIFKPKDASAASPGASTSTAAKKPAAKKPAANKAASKPTAELSEDLKKQMAEALGRLGVSPATGRVDGTPDADAIRNGSQLVGTLDAMGFKEAAAALRKYVDEAAKKVQTPAEAQPIANALPAGLTQEQREYVARVMSLEREPNKIGLLIDWLKKLSPSAERDMTIQMAQALALQLASAQSTAATMNQIDQVIRSPGIAQVQQAAAEALPPAYVPSPLPPLDGRTDGGNPITTNQTVTTSPGQPIPGQSPSQRLPETPASVPAKPVPQPVPVPASPIELAAKLMVQNLLAVQKQYGVAGAKGKEDKNLVKKFQGLASTPQAPIVADGLAGPSTFVLAAGKGAVELPLVYYWPKAATSSTVQQYKDTLSRIADKLAEVGRPNDAAQLRASAARENGQGGVTATKAAAAKPATAPRPVAAPAKPVDEVVDPRPSWPLLKQGARDSAASKANGTNYVAQWQQLLVRGGFLPNAPASTDGIFGGGTAAATKALQKAAGVAASGQDGVVGPNTRKAANFMRLW